MNKATVLKSVTAVVGAGVAAYCGQLAAPVLVLLCMMAIDYVTGMVKAYMTAQLSSRIGIKGILKKLCYMAMVAVGAGVDYLLRGALVQAGIDLISILENLAAIGVPGFPRLSKLLERLKNTVSKEEEEK